MKEIKYLYSFNVYVFDIMSVQDKNRVISARNIILYLCINYGTTMSSIVCFINIMINNKYK